MERKIRIVVATHKLYDMPSDDIYIPLHVGAEGKVDKNGNPIDFGFQKDNTGENISYKNSIFGTQTALYWAWKNLKADYIGLVHYRRLFLNQKRIIGKLQDSAITGEKLNMLIKKYSVFVPKKRRYIIDTIYNHYSNTMNGGKEQLDITREIINKNSPEYLKAFEQVMKQRSAYIFNMMIMKSELLDGYCSWLFPILFELEKKVDTTGYTDFDKRYIGRVSERLLNVWLRHQIEIGVILPDQICELPYNEDVKWFKKVISFFQAKVLKKKYTASF